MSQQMIAEVEAALARLLDPNTPAADKAQLEQQLTQFKGQPAACLPVLYELLSGSSNEYALWFAATTMEEYVAKRWAQFPAPQRQHFRQFVWEYLLSANASANASGAASGAFVVRKMRKVVADIARLEWPSANASSSGETAASASGEGWPEFMSQVEAMIFEPSTRQSGLDLLCVVVEEFGREDAAVFTSRKRYARAQLTAQLPSLLTLLSNILRASSQHLQREQAGIAEQDRIAQAALNTLNHLIMWAPVAELVNESWIALLFELAVNWQQVRARGVSSQMCLSSVAALQCLTELMGKRFQPGSVDGIVEQVLICLCPLLQKTVEDHVIGHATEQYLDKLSEFVEIFLTQHLKRLENPKYEAMLPSFLQLVLALTTKQPHVDGFLNCLSVWEVFVGYIEEVEQNEAASASERLRRALTTYELGLVGVMLHLLERVNYKTNQEQLEELNEDDDSASRDNTGSSDSGSNDIQSSLDLDKDNNSAYGTGSLQDLAQWSTDRANSSSAGATQMVELSDRKQFIVDCIALIRRIAAFPSCAPPLLERMLPMVQETCQNLVFRMHETPALPPGSDAWEHERFAIRDLTTNCAILSSVCAQHYSTSKDMNDQMAGWQILHLFITLSEYIVQHRLHTRGDAFVDMQCEALTCVRFCLSCIPFVLQSGARAQVLAATESVLQVLLQTLDTTIVPSPQVVMHNSMQLLANLGYVLSYDDMIELPSMAQLEKNIHQFSLHLPLSIQGDLYTAMSNSILNSAISMRPGSNSSNSSVQRWGNAYGALILPIKEAIEQSAMALQQNENRILESVMVTQIQRDCYLVRCLARSVETKPKVAKDSFYSAYQSTFPAIMALLTTYFKTIRKMAAAGSTPQTNSQIKQALKVINEIIQLYAQLLKSVRKEMSKETVIEIMRTFVEIFNDAQLSAILSSQGNAGLLVLCGFLRLMTIVVEEPTTAFTAFLSSILDLCAGPLKEAIFSHQESDSIILPYFVSLTEQLLENHYRFFVATSTTFNADGQRERGFASDVAHTHFLFIFQSLASVLNREGANLSPRLCSQVLALLDRIDKVQGLFAFTGFQKELRMGFLSTLMNILTRGEMNLLQDEVIPLLHRVAAADFQSFYQVFLPEYIKQILTPQEMEAAGRQGGDDFLRWSGQVDVPTFSQEVVAFLNDLQVLKGHAAGDGDRWSASLAGAGAAVACAVVRGHGLRRDRDPLRSVLRACRWLRGSGWCWLLDRSNSRRSRGLQLPVEQRVLQLQLLAPLLQRIKALLRRGELAYERLQPVLVRAARLVAQQEHAAGQEYTIRAYLRQRLRVEPQSLQHRSNWRMAIGALSKGNVYPFQWYNDPSPFCSMELLDDESSVASGGRDRSKTQKRSRNQIQDLHRQVETLRHQLESLQSDQLLEGSLEQYLQPKDSFRSLAAEQKELKERAQTQNAQLRRRLRKSRQLTAAVGKALERQIEDYRRSRIGPERGLTFASNTCEARIFALLCANLDARYSALDQELSQCASAADPVLLSQVVMHSDGGGVDFKSSSVLPFNANAICDSLCTYTAMGAVLSRHDDRGLYVRKEALPVHLSSTYGPNHVTQQRRVLGQLLLRRIDERHRTVLLWESMDEWPLESATGSSSIDTPAMHGASWAVVEPLPALGENACFLQESFSIRMHDYDRGSGDGAVNPALYGVLHQLERFYIRQRQQYGSLLVDMSLQRTKTEA